MEQYEKETYKNWIKVGYGLLELKNGISDLFKAEIKKLQTHLLQECNISPGNKCNLQTCTYKNITFSKSDKQYRLKDQCTSNICNRLITGIAKWSTQKEIIWKNCDVRAWPIDAFEIAKAYMASGHGKSTGPEDSDVSGLLQVFSHCKFFKAYKPDVVLNIRNKVMHNSNLEFDAQDMNNCFKVMSDYLLKLHKETKNVEVKKALDTLEKIKKTDLKILCENNPENILKIEQNLFKAKIAEYDMRLETIDDQMEKMNEAIEAGNFVARLSNRPDLCELLEEDIRGLAGKVSQLSDRVDQIEERGQLMENRVTTLESKIGDAKNVSSDVQHLKKQMEEVQAKLLGRKNDGKENFKGTLQIYTQKEKLKRPEYDSVPSSSNEWIASVKVCGRVYRSSESFTKIIDAEQSAASVALKDLLAPTANELESDQQTDVKGNTNYAGQLNELYPPPNVSVVIAGEKTENKQQIFLMKVKVNLSGVFQKKYLMESKKYEQDAAEQVVRILGLPTDGKASSAKALLNQYCKCVINPIWLKSQVNDESYLFMLSKYLTQAQEVEFEGDWCGSKSDARQSATKKALEFLETHDLMPVKNSIPSTPMNSSLVSQVNSPSNVNPPSDQSSASSQKVVESTVNNVMLNSGGFMKKLFDHCTELKLEELPAFELVDQGEGKFSIRVIMSYLFGPDKADVSASKPEAKEKAARVALEFLKRGQELDNKKNCVSQLQEYCQAQKLPKADFDFLDAGATQKFFALAKVCKFVVNYEDLDGNEESAKEEGAFRILKELRLLNGFDLLCDQARRAGLDQPDLKHEEGNGKFRGLLTIPHRFNFEEMYSSKKEAEKCAACGVLKRLYPEGDYTNLDKCKNLLQEKRPTEKPDYRVTNAGPDGKKFQCSITVKFDVKGENWCEDEYSATSEVISVALAKLSIE